MMKLVVALLAFGTFYSHAQEDECASNFPEQAHSSALLQVHKGEGDNTLLGQTPKSMKTCSWQLTGNQDGSQVCEHLQGKHYISGESATLDQAGYADWPVTKRLLRFAVTMKCPSSSAGRLLGRASMSATSRISMASSIGMIAPMICRKPSQTCKQRSQVQAHQIVRGLASCQTVQ